MTALERDRYELPEEMRVDVTQLRRIIASRREYDAEDPMAAAKGILLGVFFGAIFWAIAITFLLITL